MSAFVVQLAALAILSLAFLQIVSTVVESLKASRRAKEYDSLALEQMRLRVEAGTLSREVERTKATSTWSGTRKFRVQRKLMEGGEICSFYLRPHDGKKIPPFEPGQYLTFNLKLQGRDRPLVRCYSLSDSPLETDYYRVSIKRVDAPPKNPELPPGASSTYFHKELEEGDILDVKAPSGNFYLDLGKHTPVVLIGGGIGVTPMLSMLNTLCGLGSQREIWFFYGVRHGGEHIMREHLERLAAENENVKLQICYSDPREGEDELGKDYQYAERVSVELFRRLLPSNNYEYYICGPPPMMESITSDLKEWGVPDSFVHFEAFGPASVKKTATPKVESQGLSKVDVSFSRSGKTLSWDSSIGTLLDLAEANGIVMDFGCRAGSCGSCVTALKSGEVDYPEPPSAGPEDGTCLTCVAVPKSSLVLDA